MTYNIQKLVDEGYVVFTVGHTYDSMLSSLPDGEILELPQKELSQEEKKKLIEIRKDDILFVLNKLEELNAEDDVIKNKLDLKRIGVIGHSLGGAAIFRASQCDSRIKSIVLFDASLQFFNLGQDIKENQTLNVPVLNFRRGTFNYEISMKRFIDYIKDKADGEKFKREVIINDKVLRDSDEEQKNLFNYICSYKSFIKLNYSSHMIFTDYSTIIGQKMEDEILLVEMAHWIINDLTIRFLDEFLCENLGKYSCYIKNSEWITLINE